MDIISTLLDKVLALLMALLSVLPFSMPARKANVSHSADKTNYPYVFVAGFFGWGEYQDGYDKLPYWGAMTGDMVKTFNKNGYTASAASVDAVGSAWDRACELYAQLTGTIVDYGEAHSKKYGHPRYGDDYTGKALVKKWDSKNKINIICHSFGGPTCALFASILQYGNKDEQKASGKNVSSFFKGGKGSYVYSITGLAGAYNGTTMTMIADDYTDAISSLSKIAVTKSAKTKLKYFENGNVGAPDTGLYDMNPDNSVILNKGIKTVSSIYYFTVPCCTTKKAAFGKGYVPDLKITDPTNMAVALTIGKSDVTTRNGWHLGEEWQPNDGVVNTISSRGPLNAVLRDTGTVPGVSAANKGFQKGIYNVFNTYRGSHNSLCGNTSKSNFEALPYIISIMEMINSL